MLLLLQVTVRMLLLLLLGWLLMLRLHHAAVVMVTVNLWLHHVVLVTNISQVTMVTLILSGAASCKQGNLLPNLSHVAD